MKTIYGIFSLIILSTTANAQQYIPFSVQRETGRAMGIAGAEPDKFVGQLIGVGSANDLTEAKKTGGNLALGTYLIFNKKTSIAAKGKSQAKNRTVSHALYVLYNARAGNTADTAVLAKTFLFPDIGKRDFTIGYERIMPIGENNWTFTPFTEFSWNRNLLTKGNDTSSTFYSLNFTLGAKFKMSKNFSLGDDQKELGLSIYPYYQLITSDPKDFQQRNEMLNEQNLPPTFHTIGACFTLQIAELGMFFNYKRILNETADFKDNNLKDGVVVLGVVVGTSIFKFSEKAN